MILVKGVKSKIFLKCLLLFKEREKRHEQDYLQERRPADVPARRLPQKQPHIHRVGQGDHWDARERQHQEPAADDWHLLLCKQTFLTSFSPFFFLFRSSGLYFVCLDTCDKSVYQTRIVVKCDLFLCHFPQPALRNSDLERNGLYPFTGLPGSRHSCIYPATWNPSFINDDSRRRDYF